MGCRWSEVQILSPRLNNQWLTDFPVSHFYCRDTARDTELNATHAKDSQGLLRNQYLEILARAHSCNTVNALSVTQALLRLPARQVEQHSY